MNEQLQSKLVDILASLQSAIKTSGNFAIEQLPEVVTSYVLYGRIYSLISLTIVLAAFALSVFVALRFGYMDRKSLDSYGNWKNGRLCAALVGTLSSLFVGFVLIVTIKTALLVWLSPKMWLLLKIAELLK